MNHDLIQKAEQYGKKHKKQRLWKRSIGIMGLILAFSTAYALVLPAITQERPLICGYEEHTHTDECLSPLPVLICTAEENHVHDPAVCYMQKEGIICGYEETEGHTHDETCYSQQEVILCGLEETAGHIHDDSCYTEQSILGCGTEESAGHSHTDSCSNNVLICSTPETPAHSHDESCRDADGVLICGIEESAGHIHGDGCYERQITCGLSEGDGAHSHSEDCYINERVLICEQTECDPHTHDDSCKGFESVLSCGQEEHEAHTHDDSCKGMLDVLLCTEPENHLHEDGCYETPAPCVLKEHEHTDSCYGESSNPNADLESSADWEYTMQDVELTGVWAEDILAIAKTQLGYEESSRNFIYDENYNKKGYTRYGEWYGVPYCDGCAMFLAFGRDYAEISDDVFPRDAACDFWVDELIPLGLYAEADEYTPVPGDLIFYDWDDDPYAEHIGIVAEVYDTTVTAIEGNTSNMVAYRTYDLDDSCIIGYGLLPKKTEDANVEISEPTEDSGSDMSEYAAWAILVDETTKTTEGIDEDTNQILNNTFPEDEHGEMAAFSSASAIMLMSARNTTTVEKTLDLTPYINAVTMYDENGKIIPSGSVVSEGDLIEFKIDYTITGQQLAVMNGEIVTTISDALTYKIPEIFKMIQSSSGNIVNAAGVSVGTYVIDSETGIITLKFSEDFVEQNAKGIQIQGKVSFFSIVTKVTDSDSENQQFEFKDGITLGVIIEEKNEALGDLKIEKQKVSIDGEDILYEVKVTSGEGTNGPITITDQMSDGLTFKEGISVLKGNTQVDNASFITSADSNSFTLTLPEMAAGDSYTIRYRCTADVDLLGGDMTVRNTATVTGKDSHNNELKDSVTVDHTFDLLKKTGVANDDGTITWTITVNQAKADISGWTLQDILITNKGETRYNGTVTIKDSAENTVASDVTLPYTFPQGSKDTYTITYTTSHDYEEGATIYNRASLKDDNTDVTVLSSVGIGTPITKSGTAGEVTQIDGKYVLPITWTVTIDTSIGAIPAGEVLMDTMEDWTANEMYMTYEQLMAAYENIKAALEAAGSAVSEFEAKEYKSGMGQNSDEKYDYNTLTGNVNSTHGKLYEYFEVTLGKAIPKGKIITFTYETSGIFENNVPAGSAYTNQFSISDQYQVKSTVQFTAGEVKAKKMALSYYDPAAHKDTFWHWSLYDYNGTDGITKLEYEKLHQDYLAWTIELSVPPEYLGKGNIVLYEDLPEGVTLKGLTLPFRDNVPTRPMTQMPNGQPLQLWDVKPGNTYEWTFNLYTAEQYNNWNHQGGQMVTITVNVTEDGDLEIIIPGIIFETMAQYATLQNQEEWYAYLHVFTQIDEDFAWTPTDEDAFVYVNAFENCFTITNENGDVIDLGSQTQEITKDESKGIIRKEATTDENNIIHYSVVLNAYGKDLIENSGTLRIHDELTYQSTEAQPLRLRLVPGSVKLYEVRMYSDGSYEKLGEVTTNYSYAENASEQYDITNRTHTIDLNVPDGKALVLEYSYKADGNKNVPHSVQNTCSIKGVGEGSLDGEHKVEIQVKESDATADIKGVLLYKVDANSDGIFLENAKFNIYIWNEAQNDYIIVHHPDNGDSVFTTNANGMIVIDDSTMEQFAYNTAYYIVELESPEGYYLGPEPYYFYIVNEDTVAYPSCLPDGFVGHALTSGDIIYRQNVSEFTEITVEKYWKSYNGPYMTVTGEQVSSITLELWQMLQGDPDSAKRYGTYTMTPNADGEWSLTITDLPKAAKNADGTKGTDYLYYIKEVGVNGFTLESSENNDGITSGIIKLVNREQEGYELPETGGPGTTAYTIAGLALMTTACGAFLHRHRKKTKKDPYTS